MIEPFLYRLNLLNIGTDEELVKNRVKDIWHKGDKTKKRELIAFTGSSMYGIVEKAIKDGHIDAKTTLLLSKYFNVSPFYIIGQTDKPGKYDKSRLEHFLKRFGYAHVWRDYLKYKRNNIKVDDKRDTENVNSDNSNISAVGEFTDISPELLNIINKLSKKEIINLMQALLVRLNT